MTVGLESLFILVLADLLLSLFNDAAHYSFLSLSVLMVRIPYGALRHSAAEPAPFSSGGTCGNRTRDQRIKSPLLYRLS